MILLSYHHLLPSVTYSYLCFGSDTTCGESEPSSEVAMHALVADYHIYPHCFSLAYWYESIRVDGLELVLDEI